MHVAPDSSLAVDVLLNTLAAERFVRKALLHDLLDMIDGRSWMSRARPLVEDLLSRVGEPKLDERDFQSAVARIREEIRRELDDQSSFAMGSA